MAPRTKISDLLTVTQAANYLGLGRQAIWMAIQRGRIKARTIGNVLIVSRKALDRYKSSRKSTGRPPKK